MRDTPPTFLPEPSDASGATDTPTAPLGRADHGDTAATTNRAPSPFDRGRLGWGWLANGVGDRERTD
jgi:hypothetical protein